MNNYVFVFPYHNHAFVFSSHNSMSPVLRGWSSCKFFLQGLFVLSWRPKSCISCNWARLVLKIHHFDTRKFPSPNLNTICNKRSMVLLQAAIQSADIGINSNGLARVCLNKFITGCLVAGHNSQVVVKNIYKYSLAWVMWLAS